MLQNPYELLWAECPELASCFENVLEAQRHVPGLDEVTRQLINVAIHTANRNPAGVYVNALMARAEGASRDAVVAAVVMNLPQSGLSAVLESLPSAVAAFDANTAERLVGVR